MKVLIVKETDVKLALKESVNLLNNICHSIKFDYVEYDVKKDNKKQYVDYNIEIVHISNKYNGCGFDHILYITNRKYENNYYYYFNQYIMVLSIDGWKYYTNLPVENGLFYFIADMLALTFNTDIRHDNTTGCIYDFKYDKTAVDEGMRQGYICDECLKRLQPVYEASPNFRSTFIDFEKILNILSNASKWNKNVIKEVKIDSEIKYSWSNYENEVADIFRKLGVKVKQNVDLSGFQIDILIEEETPSNQKMLSIVECKYHKNKIGNRIINDFYRKFKTIKEVNNIDKAIFVSYSGYSQKAHILAKNVGIELLTYNDLKQKIKKDFIKKPYVKSSILTRKKDTIITVNYPDVFTIMPFNEHYDDIYFLGIHDTVKNCGYTCERVDEIEYVGDVLEKICDLIKNSKIIVAELTEPNPNVYYELGYAYALGKTVIPLTKEIKNAPFDVRQFNHITYNSIRELREKLEKRIKSI